MRKIFSSSTFFWPFPNMLFPGLGYSWQAWLCPLLGTWHLYKQASIWTFKLASKYFLAPLFHELYPNKRFYDHPKLKEITHMLSLVRLTYPLWQGELKAAREIPELPTKDQLHLMNLYQLAEFVIPKVSLS